MNFILACVLTMPTLQPPVVVPPTEPSRPAASPRPPIAGPRPSTPPDPGPPSGGKPGGGSGVAPFSTGVFPFGATMATFDPNGNVSIELVISEFVPETATRTVSVQGPNGRTELRTETITVMKSIFKSERRPLPRDVKVYRNGQELSADDKRALRTPTPIFITSMGTPDRAPGHGYEALLRDSLVAFVPAMRRPVPAGPGPISTTPSPMPDTALGDASTFEREVIEKVNAERAAAGLPALKLDPTLMKAARQHSASMAKQQKLDHVLDGKGPGERLSELGMRPTFTGENCAQGQQTGAEAMQSWMGSDGHRGNILNPSYSHIGVGKADGPEGPYWTQVFAKIDES